MFKNETGYVLVNLLVSVLFIAVMITVSIPHIRNYRITSKLSAVGREVATQLRRAQQMSVTEQAVHGIVFDTASDTYKLEKYNGATTTLNSYVLGGNIDLTRVNGLTDDRVEFNFYGGASESGEVILESVNSHQITIEIKPSGYVQIK